MKKKMMMIILNLFIFAHRFQYRLWFVSDRLTSFNANAKRMNGFIIDGVCLTCKLIFMISE